MSKKIGRNEPCPCGSGKKYKKCCLGSGANDGKEVRGSPVTTPAPSPAFLDHYISGPGKRSRSTNIDDSPSSTSVIDPPEDRVTVVFELSYNPGEIRRKTRDIHRKIIERSECIDEGNYTLISVDDLVMMFELYDGSFFNGYFADNHPGEVRFDLSDRMTKAGAKTYIYSEPEMYVIALSSHLLYQTFSGEDRAIVVNGIACKDRLEAAQRLFEHELIHVLERMLFGESKCSKPRFRGLARRIFGHTDVTHHLVTGAEVASYRGGLRVGDKVTFDFKGESFQGIISRITKRATVMVRNAEGAYRDPSGETYSKYYIPLDDLERSG